MTWLSGGWSAVTELSGGWNVVAELSGGWDAVAELSGDESAIIIVKQYSWIIGWHLYYATYQQHLKWCQRNVMLLHTNFAIMICFFNTCAMNLSDTYNYGNILKDLHHNPLINSSNPV